LAPGEQVAAFVGKSHELVTIDGGSCNRFGSPDPRAMGDTFKTIRGIHSSGRWFTHSVPPGNAVAIWPWGLGTTHALVAKAGIATDR
jgi:hypothetical protein